MVLNKKKSYIYYYISLIGRLGVSRSSRLGVSWSSGLRIRNLFGQCDGHQSDQNEDLYYIFKMLKLSKFNLNVV